MLSLPSLITESTGDAVVSWPFGHAVGLTLPLGATWEGPHLSCGSPHLAKYPFGPLEWRPSLGFTADRLTWDWSSGSFMSDNGRWPCCHRPIGMILIDPVGLFMSSAGSIAPTRQTTILLRPAGRKGQNEA